MIDLCRNKHLVPTLTAGKCLADDLLARTAGVEVAGINQVDTGIE